jgi:hypothetical protein
MTIPGARLIPDAEAEMSRLARGRVPARPDTLCRETHVIQTPHGDFWAQLEITVSPLLPDQEAQEWPYPVRSDLGETVAEIIREGIPDA